MRHELGEGGAPEESRIQMEQLVDDYAKRWDKLMEMGFNGDVLDLKPKTVMVTNSSVLNKDEEELIEEIMEKRIISMAGGLYKVGVIIANCRAATQAGQQSLASMRQTIDEGIEKRKTKEKSDCSHARAAFWRWVDKGRKVTLDGDPDIKTKAVISLSIYVYV